MKNTKPLYHGHRFPPEIISHAVWLYHRFCHSFRDVEDLLAERGVEVSYESIWQAAGQDQASDQVRECRCLFESDLIWRIEHYLSAPLIHMALLNGCANCATFSASPAVGVAQE
jgi:transposase-like protein